VLVDHADVPSELVPTGVAARAVGVHLRTLQRWVKEGLIEPDVVTPGGHMRWDVQRLLRQIQDLPR
jgi:DNA-binding transcriptional MerR regulator